MCLFNYNTSFWSLWALKSMPKGKKMNSWLHFIPKNDTKNVFYKICRYISFKVSVLLLFTYRSVLQLSVPILYVFISISIHRYYLVILVLSHTGVGICCLAQFLCNTLALISTIWLLIQELFSRMADPSMTYRTEVR